MIRMQCNARKVVDEGKEREEELSTVERSATISVLPSPFSSEFCLIMGVYVRTYWIQLSNPWGWISCRHFD